MKAALTLIISLVTIQLATSQVEFVVGTSNIQETVATKEQIFEFTSTRRLSPDIPGKAIRGEYRSTYGSETESTSGIGVEMGLAYKGKLSSKLSYKARILFSYISHGQLQSLRSIDQELISGDTINHTFPTTTTTSFDNCDVYEEDPFSVRAYDDINILSMDISASVEYGLYKDIFALGAGVYFRSPWIVNKETNTIRLERREENNQTICTWTNHVEHQNNIDNLAHITVGFAPYISYKVSEQFDFILGSRIQLTDSYTTPNNDSSFFRESPSYTPTQFYFQVAYKFHQQASKAEVK